MPKPLSGQYGAVYYNAELTNTSTTGNIYFSTGKTITSSGNAINFEDEGYSTGMLISVSGCTTSTGNNKIFTISAVSSGQLTVSEAVSAASPEEGAVTFTEAEPGVEVCGFFNWTLSYASDVLETTDFCNSTGGGRTYIPGLTSWTVTADKHFLTANNVVDDWVGQTCEIRLFTKYVSSPSTGNPAQYWRGDTIVTGLDETTPVDALIDQSISFQGDRALTLVTKTSAWNTT